MTPTDYMQLTNRANVAVSRARYHLTIVAAESTQFRMKLGAHGGLDVSTWGDVMDTALREDSGVFDGGGGPMLGGRPILAVQRARCLPLLAPAASNMQRYNVHYHC